MKFIIKESAREAKDAAQNKEKCKQKFYIKLRSHCSNFLSSNGQLINYEIP